MRYAGHLLHEGEFHAAPLLAILRSFLLRDLEALVEECLPEGLVPPSFADVLVTYSQALPALVSTCSLMSRLGCVTPPCCLRLGYPPRALHGRQM